MLNEAVARRPGSPHLILGVLGNQLRGRGPSNSARRCASWGAPCRRDAGFAGVRCPRTRGPCLAPFGLARGPPGQHRRGDTVQAPDAPAVSTGPKVSGPDVAVAPPIDALLCARRPFAHPCPPSWSAPKSAGRGDGRDPGNPITRLIDPDLRRRPGQDRRLPGGRPPTSPASYDRSTSPPPRRRALPPVAAGLTRGPRGRMNEGHLAHRQLCCMRS